MARRCSGTATSWGPFETTSFTVSPRCNGPMAGVCEMTMPLGTLSENCSSLASTLRWCAFSTRCARAALLPVQSAIGIGCRPRLTTRSTTVCGLSRLPCGGLLPMTVPLPTVSDQRLIRCPKVRWAARRASCAWLTFLPCSFGTAYSSRPFETVSVTVPWSSTRAPGSGSVVMTSPFGTLSENAAEASATLKPACSSLWVAACWPRPRTLGVAV